MRKNYGNGIVKRVIAVAMATMLVAATPMMESVASESSPSLSTEDINTKIDEAVEGAKDYVESGKLDNVISKAEESVSKAETMVKELENLNLDTLNDNIPAIKDAAEQASGVVNEIKDNIDKIKAPVLSDGEAAIVGGLYDELTGVYNEYSDENGFVNHYDVYDITDDVKDTVNGVVGGVIEQEVTDADKAATEAETIVADTKKAVDTLNNYESATSTLLENTEFADSMEKLQTSVESAENAAVTAQDSLNNILTDSKANIAEERAKIEQAIVDAENAEAEAKDAYSTAQAVLLDQIKKYNAYAAQYGEKLYALADGTTPAYTAEELETLKGLDMTGKDITDKLNDLKNTDLSKQWEEIEVSKSLVDSCETSLKVAKDAVAYAKGVEESLVSNLTKLRDEAKTAAENADPTQKALLEKIYEHTNFILTEYTKDLTPEGATTVNPTGKTDSIENRLDYALDSADTLTQEIDVLVTDANNKLSDTLSRYNTAKADYDKLMTEYNTYLATQNTVGENFAKLQAKLEAATKAVEVADAELEKAAKAVQTANDVKAKFEEAVANKNGNKNESSNSGSSSSSSNKGGSTATTVTVVKDANGYATISEVPVALGDAVPAMDAPVLEITEEPAPLTDAVPKTGDASTAAGAVGASGLFAMLGALILGNKKRTLR